MADEPAPEKKGPRKLVLGQKEKKTSEETQLGSLKQTMAQIHADCDFLIENHSFRKDARANEVEALKNAKAVLHGADYS